MASQHAGTDKQTSDKGKILAIFENVGIFDSEIFDQLLTYAEGQGKLKKSLFCGGEMAEPREIDCLKWEPVKNVDASRRNVTFVITCLDTYYNYERRYRRYAAVTLLESYVFDIRIQFSTGMIIFIPCYSSKFKVVSEGGVVMGSNLSEINTNIESWSVTPFLVPISIFACWLKGNLEDPSRGIQIEASNDTILTYGGKKYPTKLYRWANGKGLTALDTFLSEQLMSKESYDIIKKMIAAQLEVPSDAPSTNLYENHADPAEGLAREPTSFAELGDVQPTSHPHGPSLQEIRLLVVIGNQEGSIQNYSSWATLLGYSSKSSVSEFFKKMEGIEILTAEKTPRGTRVNLTPYGKQLIIR